MSSYISYKGLKLTGWALSLWLFVACTTNGRKEAPVYQIQALELNQFVLPFKHIDNLKQPVQFLTLHSDTIQCAHFAENVISKYNFLFSPSVQTLVNSFEVPIVQEFDFIGWLNPNTALNFRGHSRKFYLYNTSANSNTVYFHPTYYEPLLKDTFQLTADYGIDTKPVNNQNDILFSVFQIFEKQPISINLAFESIFSAPSFVHFDAKHGTFKTFLSLNQLGLAYDSTSFEKYSRIDTRVHPVFFEDVIIVCSSKSEDLYLIDRKRLEILRTLNYSHCASDADFKLTTNEVPKGAEYIRKSGFYEQSIMLDKQGILLRVLKRGASNENQTGQGDTPWQIIAIDIKHNGKKMFVLDFAPGEFDYADIHLVADRYLLVSNRGILNSHYESKKHSYSVLDLFDYIK